MSVLTEPGPIEFTADEHPKTRTLALDGLRAFAVASVLAFHGGVTHLHGGYLGVDVFFALSGFLITSLLLSEYQSRDTIGLGRFYLRRAKRLLPALMLVIVAVCAVTLWVSPPGLFPDLRSDVVATFFYFSNWHLMNGSTNYFAMLVPPSPFTHTWSLAIEEQFYIVWPLVVLGLMRWRKSVSLVGGLAVVGAVGSASLMLYGFHHHWAVDRLYYGTDTHAEGLLLGAATACWLLSVRRRTPMTGTTDPTRWLAVAGPVAMVGGLLIMARAHGNSHWMFEGGFFAMAVCSCVTVAYLVTRPQSKIARGLSWRPVVYIGQISYGIYLWHFPIFHWLTSYQSGLSVWPLLAVRVAITLVVAAASYHFVEMPIRRGSWPRSWRGGVVALVAMALVFAASFTMATKAAEVPYPQIPTARPSVTPIRVLYLGDSMMFTLSYSVSIFNAHYGIVGYNGALLGCGLIPSSDARIHGMVEKRPRDCQLHAGGSFAARRKWVHLINQFKPNVVVVLAGRWETSDLKIRGQWVTIDDASMRQRVTNSLATIATASVAQHAALVFMTTPCSWDGEMANGVQWDENSPARLRRYNQLIRADAKLFHAHLFNLGHLACPTGHLQYFIDGVMVRQADGIHFATDSGAFLAPRLFPYLRRLHIEATGPSTAATS
jgi:peptidoglycan/LPS O-acetylase OafA/YrhL